MAFPVITFDRDEGEDGNDASGAGPATAKKGTLARNRAGGASRVGLYEATAPDLSQVAVDGSHALKLGTGSGRQWFKVTAKKETVETPTGDATASSATLTNVSSTTGLANGDAIKVAGAGAAGADLYTTISSFTASTIVMLDTALTLATGTTITCPKQVTAHASVTLSADTAWAIGGKRGTIDGMSQLWLDLLPGWTVELKKTNTKFALTAQVVLAVSGDATDGRITIRGGGAGASRPTIEGDNVISLFAVRAAYITLQDLILDKCDKCVAVDSSAAADVLFDGLSPSKGTGNTLNYGVHITSAATGRRFHFRNCDFRSWSTAAIDVDGAITTLLIENCFFTSTAGNAIDISTAPETLISRCVFYDQINYGVLYNASAVAHVMIEACVFEGLGNGVNLDAEASRGAVVRNCVFANCSGTALAMAGGADQIKGVVDYNDFYNNGTARSGVSAGANDLALDPKFRAKTAFDFRIGVNLKALGWPRSLHGSLSPTYEDIGYAQRREPIGGTISARVLSVSEGASDWFATYEVTGGNSSGVTLTATIPKSAIPASGDLVTNVPVYCIAAALREVAASTLVGQEVLP